MARKRLLNFIELHDVHIFQQLQYEEILLRSTQKSWCLINKGPIKPVIVTGLSGKIHELVHLEKAKSDSIPIIRRYSGGGTVIVDKDTLFITLIADASDLNIPPYPRDIMKWSEGIYSPVFGQKFSLRENDYALENLKFGGNAQSITRNRFVHHTSFLWNYSPFNMDYLQIPKKMPEYRQHRTHKDFITTLHAHFPSIDHITENLRNSLTSVYDVQTLSQDELNKEYMEALGSRNILEASRTRYENY